MRKVLMVAQAFPPAGRVGSIRVTKFVKYLREFGWEPIVLTVRQDCYPDGVWLDQSLMKDIPGDIVIYRTGIWHTRAINDEGIRWLPFLLSTIGKVVEKEEPRALYLTGGPFFPLMAGPIVKFLHKLPCVVDLRDPWRLARRTRRTRGLKGLVGGLLTNVAEPLVLRNAAKIICVSEHMCEEYREAYPHLARKFVVVTNGYDPNDVANIAPHCFDRFTVAYTGKFMTSESFRDPGPFFKALRRCRDLGRDIQFVHVGAIEQEVISMAQQAGVSESVRFIGPLPHSEALAYAKGAHALLAIGGGHKTEQTGKIFDYIVCGRPILVLAPHDSELARVSREVAFAKVLSNNNPEAIARALRDLYHQNSAGILIRPSPRSKFERRCLAEELAKTLSEVCS